MVSIIGHYHISTAARRRFVESQVRNVNNLMSPEPASKGSWGNREFYLPAYFLLTLKCFVRNEGFEFLLLTSSKTFSFYLLCCVLQQSGHWEAFRLVRSSLYLLHFWLCLLKGSPLAGKRKQLKALAKRYPWSPGCFICAAHNIHNGETRIASFFFSSVWGKQGDRLHIIGLNSLLNTSCQHL